MAAGVRYVALTEHLAITQTDTRGGGGLTAYRYLQQVHQRSSCRASKSLAASGDICFVLVTTTCSHRYSYSTLRVIHDEYGEVYDPHYLRRLAVIVTNIRPLGSCTMSTERCVIRITCDDLQSSLLIFDPSGHAR